MSVSVAAGRSKTLSNVANSSRSTGVRALSVAIYLHDLSGGGVERQTLIIAEEFRRHGADVTLVLHRLRGQLLDQVPAGLRIVDLKSSRTVMDIPGLIKFLRSEKPDILLSNVDLNNVAALLAKAISFSGTKVVICQHNPISKHFAQDENWAYRYIGAAYRLLAPMISRAVAVSDGVAAELKAIAKLPENLVLTINNPVVGPDFQERCEGVADHPWLQNPSGPVFVTAGRLVLQKDHETLIRAMAIYRRNGNGRLLILGTGPRHDILVDLVARLNLTEAIDFVGFRAGVLPFFRQADAFVMSSRCEGFGNVIVEALGCGTPVISTRCDHGPSEILDDGRYGLLVEQQNPAALAEAMDQVATLRERFPADMLRQRAGEYSYAACASRYMAMFKVLSPYSALAASA